MPELAIKVEGLGKQYRLGTRSIPSYGRLTESISDALTGPFRRVRNAQTALRVDRRKIWALRDVSFGVHEGEVVGVVGHNGAGKSTLLKILSRITAPTTGRAEIHGHVGSLLEVGTGFHPELTGAENVYLNGAIYGMRRAEIASKFDAIVDFAGLAEFMDTPVKRYSSGMYVRLAFSVAAHLEPEILLIDEVLAVGDLAFQRKCLGRMDEIAHGGRTILFVSHNLTAVSALCSRAILVDHGKLAADGEVRDVISRYLELTEGEERKTSLHLREDRSGDGSLRFTSVELTGAGGPVVLGEDAELLLDYEAPRELQNVTVGAAVNTLLGEPVCFLGTRVSGLEIASARQRGTFRCTIPRLPLAPGRYSLNVHADVNGSVADWVQHESCSTSSRATSSARGTCRRRRTAASSSNTAGRSRSRRARSQPRGRRLIARKALRRLRRRWSLDRSSSAALTRSNTRRAYEALYGSRELLDEYLAPARLAFYDEVATACAELRPASVVDLGCGSGHLLRALLDRLPEARALGVDHAASGIDVARELVPEARFAVGDLYRLTPPERFDLVVSTEVLEHLTRPREGVERMLDWCAEGGRVAVTVPDGAWDAFEGHENFWSEDELRDFLAPHGLKSIMRIDIGPALFAVLEPRS